MENKLYIICSKSEQEQIESLLKDQLAEKGFTLVTYTVNSDPDTWEEPVNAERVALWLTPNTDNAVYTISARRQNAGKQTINIFPQEMFLTADKKRSVGRNQSIFSSLHPSGIATILCSLLPKPEVTAPKQEPAQPQPAPAPAEPKPEVENVQQQTSQSTEPQTEEKEEKKFPTKFVWIIIAIVAALVVFYIIGNEEDEVPQLTEVVEDNHLSEGQLVNLIQLANKGDLDALTDEFVSTIAQYAEAPNVVWEGGISKPDWSPELLVEQSELGNNLSVEILEQSYSNDDTQGEIVFEYFTQFNGHESPRHKAVAYLVNRDGDWKIYDFGMDATNYGNQPAFYLSRYMSTYITDSNYRVQSGETFRDLNLLFAESPEEVEAMVTQVREYAEKYDVEIPDSLTYYYIPVAE